MRWLLAVLALGGCRELFSIDPIPFAGDAGSNTGDGGGGVDAPVDAAGVAMLTVKMSGVGDIAISNLSGCSSITTNTCVYSFVAGSTVLLTPSPAVSNLFNYWGGACETMNATDTMANPTPGCSLRVSGAETVTAFFVADNVFAFNLMPDATNDADMDAKITAIQLPPAGIPSGASYDSVSVNAPIITLGRTLPGDGCAGFGGFTGSGCSAGAPSCTVNFASVHVVNVYYDFVPEDGTNCTN